MALSMRLSRGGSKKRPYYKIVVADARAPRDGKFIERIGSYNPQLPKDSAERMIIDAERAKHWLAAGAQPSDRVARFLDIAGVKERKVKSNPNKGEPGQKAKDRAEDKATKLAEAEEAAAAAAAAPAPEPEPEVVEEVVVEEKEVKKLINAITEPNSKNKQFHASEYDYMFKRDFSTKLRNNKTKFKNEIYKNILSLKNKEIDNLKNRFGSGVVELCSRLSVNEFLDFVSSSFLKSKVLIKDEFKADDLKLKNNRFMKKIVSFVYLSDLF